MRPSASFASAFASAFTVAAVLIAGGCSSGPELRTLAGRVDTTALRLDNAQVVAVAASGRTFRAPIDRTGAFTIALPVGATYTIRFANATTTATRFDAFGTLVVTRAGTRSRYLTLTSGPTIGLGRVALAGSAAPTSSTGGGLGTASDGDGTADDHAGGDDSGREDDDAEVCDLSSGGDDAELEAEHDPSHDCDADHDGTADADDDHDDRQACGSKNDDDCAHSSDQEHELDRDHDAPCSSTTTATPAPSPSPGVIG